MPFKVGARISSMIHESGEDIIVSYRTGAMALIKDGKIAKIYTDKNYHEIHWQRQAWEQAAQLEAVEQEQKQLESFHKAVASAAANSAADPEKAATEFMNNVTDKRK